MESSPGSCRAVSRTRPERRRQAAVPCVCACGLLLLWAGAARGQEGGWGAGRALDPNKTFSVRVSYGQVDGVEGEVRELKRAGAAQVTTEGKFLEEYSFEELGFDEGYGTLGVELEKQWKYITLVGDLKYANVEGDAVARRAYAIGVEEVWYNGQEYEYMLIPKGQSFHSEMDLLVLDARMRITPCHVESGERFLSFTPWATLGIFAMGGSFTIDAGPPQGITTYEIDPYPYVIGGTADGTAGGLLPAIGAGGELRIGLTEGGHEGAELVLQADFTFLDLAARTGDFGVSSRNEKNIDTEYYNLDFRAQLEIPMNEEIDFLVGAGVKYVDANAEIEADRHPPGVTTTEKYDKAAEVEMTFLYLFTGLKF